MADNEVTVRIVTEADTAQVEDLTTSIDNVQSSAEKASGAVDQLGNSTENVNGDSMSQAGQNADDLSQNANKADQEIQNLNNDLGMLDASAMLSIASELSQLGAEAENMAQDMNAGAVSISQLSTQTGIAEPQLTNMINTITNAAFPHEDAYMYVQSLDQIGVASQNLGQSATDLDAINDAFGLGAKTTNSLGQELSVLGVDMNNISSSFNALAYANANTVGGMDNYYNFLRKYDAQFKELGFNVDQASVIIAGATHKFGGGKAALSGLNEALKESNGDTRALEQALGLQAGALDNATQLTGQYEGQLQEMADAEEEHTTLLQKLGDLWEDLSLKLEPVLSPLMSAMGLIGQAGSWAVGVNGLIELGKATKDATVVQWLWNAALSANPITLIVLAIAALIAILAYLYFNNEQVRNSINALGQSFILVGQIIYTTVMNIVNWVITQLQNLWNYIMTLGGLLPEQANITGNQIVDSILMVLAFIATLPAQIAMYFANVIASAMGFGDNFVQTMINAASQAVSGFVSWITQLPQRLGEELDKMIQQALDFAARLPQIIGEAAANMVGSWVGGSGEQSPGFMYDRFEGELKAMDTISSSFSKKLPTTMGLAGSGMVEKFNPNFDSGNGSVVGGNTYNITLEIGSVDKRERVNEIIEAIRDYIEWDNTTAGRTV